MENVTVQSRISLELKDQSEKILNQMGFKTSEAIRIFLQQVVNSRGMPFQPSLQTPNTETIKAIKELNAGKGKSSKNSSKLFESLGI